jgi:mannose-1-phosphate guanylyltransferase
VVTSEDYIDLVQEQLPFLSTEQILAEPIRRNTAPCVAYACYKIAKRNPDANIVVAPADHIILKEKAFQTKILTALEASAKGDVLVTLGISPSRPDTGYGYIQYKQEEGEVKKVESFREKPNLELAKQFLASGEYVWNAGIFIWTAKSIITAFASIHLVYTRYLKMGLNITSLKVRSILLKKLTKFVKVSLLITPLWKNRITYMWYLERLVGRI